MSDATSSQPQISSQTLEQSLNKTDLGHFIFENRKLFFIFLAAILFGVSGYLIWKQQQKAENMKISLEVFKFQSEVWAPVKEDKKTPQELLTAFNTLNPQVKTSPEMSLLALEMGKFLFDKELYNEVLSLLSAVDLKSPHPVTNFFLTMQKVVVLEKLEKIDEAIKLLEPLAQKSDTLFPSRVSLDLGRLYLMKSEKGKAQTQLDYVIKTFPNDEEAKLAKLYLQNLSR